MAAKLSQLGLVEGAPHRHPGQGTACRRFFFRNAMLELLWVEDAEEAQSAQARSLRLWDRLSNAGNGASPLGMVVRPEGGSAGPRLPWIANRPSADRPAPQKNSPAPQKARADYANL